MITQSRGIIGFIRRLLRSPKKSAKKDAPIESDSKNLRKPITGAQKDSILKGMRLLCTLDEKTCLKCLNLDGSENSVKLPIHEGCRCVMIPISKSWKELGVDIDEVEEGTRSSAIGQVPGSGGLYKAYLIERAKAIEKGIQGETLDRHLRELLPSLYKSHPRESSKFSRIKASLLSSKAPDDLSEIESVLRNLEWTFDSFEPLFTRCAELNRFDLIDETLKRLVKQIPGGPFAPRHKGTLYRTASNSVRRFSAQKALEYSERALEVDPQNTSVMTELGKVYRRAKRFDEAKAMFEKVLTIKPNHKEAKREMGKL